MNLDQLRIELAEDEGCKYEIYLDHLGLPTCGIGHLITADDPESAMSVGTEISEERVQLLFRRDVSIAVDECKRLYPDFDQLPEEVQRIICNMMFNMGYPRLSKFVGMKSAIDNKLWDVAADEMIDSRWFDQVPNRAKRLVARMRAVESDDA
jgi:lysozyme